MSPVNDASAFILGHFVHYDPLSLLSALTPPAHRFPRRIRSTTRRSARSNRRGIVISLRPAYNRTSFRRIRARARGYPFLRLWLPSPPFFLPSPVSPLVPPLLQLPLASLRREWPQPRITSQFPEIAQSVRANGRRAAVLPGVAARRGRRESWKERARGGGGGGGGGG